MQKYLTTSKKSMLTIILLFLNYLSTMHRKQKNTTKFSYMLVKQQRRQKSSSLHKIQLFTALQPFLHGTSWKVSKIHITISNCNFVLVMHIEFLLITIKRWNCFLKYVITVRKKNFRQKLSVAWV